MSSSTFGMSKAKLTFLLILAFFVNTTYSSWEHTFLSNNERLTAATEITFIDTHLPATPPSNNPTPSPNNSPSQPAKDPKVPAPPSNNPTGGPSVPANNNTHVPAPPSNNSVPTPPSNNSNIPNPPTNNTINNTNTSKPQSPMEEQMTKTIVQQCPAYVHDVWNDKYQASTSQVHCRPNVYKPTSYNPYFIYDMKLAANTSYETYSIRYCDPDQEEWLTEKAPIVQFVNVTIYYMKHDVIEIKYIDPNETRWEIPQRDPFPRFTEGPQSTKNESIFTVQATSIPFSISVIRKDTGETIWNTAGFDFIYSDTFLEVSTRLPTPNIYGFGERIYSFNLGPTGTFTLWNKDKPWTMDNGRAGTHNYGSHPMYLQKEQSGNFSIVYLRNSNAMDVRVENSQSLTYFIAGGILDFVFFAGDSKPETVTEKYHEYLGGWKQFPFWSFGYHQCRWGYYSVDRLVEVVQGFKENHIPLDVIWSDIDYMDDKIDFTLQPGLFQAEKFNKIYETKKRWVPIIDAGVAKPKPGRSMTDQSVIYFKDGLSKNVYLKTADGVNNLEASVWPGPVHFPDFLNPNTSAWWQSGFALLKAQANFSGIWLDMNEVSNFCEGECDWYDQCRSPYDQLPYYPGWANLKTMTVRMDAVHYSPDPKKKVHEFNVHNYFGFLQTQSTHDYLATQSNLTFILTRSNMPGSGKFTAHWLGDNNSSWSFMKASISGIMSMNLFGIPMAGADVCGFNLNTYDNMCARWYQLGSLYPFFRNHNKDDSINQEPWVLGSETLETSKVTLRFRYAIMKYYYQLFLNKRGKGTIFKPVFYEFPNDEELFQIGKPWTDEQFMVGEALMAAPVLTRDTNHKDVYFPKDNWFDFFTGEALRTNDQKSDVLTVPAPVPGNIPLFIRGGNIVHLQNTERVLQSDDLDDVFTLVIALKKENNTKTAFGKIAALQDYNNDTNVVEKCIDANCMLEIRATYETEENYRRLLLSFEAEDDSIDALSSLEPIRLGNLTLYGLEYGDLSDGLVIHNKDVLAGGQVYKDEKSGFLSVKLPNITINSGDILVIEAIEGSILDVFNTK
jgi:alpha-glucosidase (family GH31 glycosyl hydrolase)